MTNASRAIQRRAALEYIVDDVDNITDIYIRIAVGVGRNRRFRCRTMFEDVLCDDNGIAEIDAAVGIGITGDMAEGDTNSSFGAGKTDTI